MKSESASRADRSRGSLSLAGGDDILSDVGLNMRHRQLLWSTRVADYAFCGQSDIDAE